MPVLFDIVIVLLLVLFACRGAAKGLILSLCGLAAVFVAFFAAQIVSDAFCVPVAGIIRPVITQSIEDAAQRVENLTIGAGESGYTVSDLMDYLKENELFQGFSDMIEQAVAADGEEQDALPPAAALADYLSKGISKVVLFAIVFIGVQIAWFLASHALDLAFKLPILAEVNLGGGLAFGLIEGVLLIIVLVWLGQVSGVVPAEPDTPVLSLFTVDRLSEMLAKLPA